MLLMAPRLLRPEQPEFSVAGKLFKIRVSRGDLIYRRSGKPSGFCQKSQILVLQAFA